MRAARAIREIGSRDVTFRGRVAFNARFLDVAMRDSFLYRGSNNNYEEEGIINEMYP